MDFPGLHFVLSGFTGHLTSHFVKPFSSHSYRYEYLNDLPNCFASYAIISGSLVQHAGKRRFEIRDTANALKNVRIGSGKG